MKTTTTHICVWVEKKEKNKKTKAKNQQTKNTSHFLMGLCKR